MDMLIDRSHIPLVERFGLPFDPMVKMFLLDLPKPTLDDPVGDVDRVVCALKKELSSTGPADAAINVPLGLAQRIGRTLRQAAFRVTAIAARKGHGYELLDVRAGREQACFGLGIDVGTTIITLYLVDLVKGDIVSKAVAENAQAIHGEDILTRIHFCQTDGGLEELRGLSVDGINEALAKLAQAAKASLSDIFSAAIAGNPAMMHLLLGLDPYYLCREPYVPAFNLPLEYRAKEVGLSILPDAPVYVFPNLGSYFGGDVIAGIVASGMHRSKSTSLLVDVGTNAEIVLGNRDWFVACAGAAGPALESGGAKMGMRAVSGAIENVRINRETLEPSYDVIGGCAPRGVCGSGFIDLVSELYSAGILDSKGRIRDAIHSPRICSDGTTRGYALALASRAESARDIIIDEHDITNLLRGKGAMYTALSLITERLGVRFSDLETFFVAGSFGEHINPRHAITIGMLPDIPLERYKVLGNSAGLGACLLLISSGLRQVVEEIRRKATYIQLTTDNEFMSRLSAALFIPHTDKTLFPSVKTADS